MELLKFAAIDIGSNAVRLLLVNVLKNRGKAEFRKSSIVRMPVRLGDAVFENQLIPDDKVEKLIHTLKAYHHLMEVQDVVSYKACATSAMREADNGVEIVERIKHETGISIDIISGDQEASIIYSNGVAEKIDESKPYLYVDVGGGSTEISLFYKNEVIASRSFKMGTVRMLKNLVKEGVREEMKSWLRSVTEDYQKLELIGTGGNINKFFKLARRKEGKPISYYHLMELYDKLEALSYEERIKTVGLNPDRADVIIPAGEIFLNIMRWTNVKRIFIPKIGLADGMVKQLYKEYASGK